MKWTLSLVCTRVSHLKIKPRSSFALLRTFEVAQRVGVFISVALDDEQRPGLETGSLRLVGLQGTEMILRFSGKRRGRDVHIYMEEKDRVKERPLCLGKNLLPKASAMWLDVLSLFLPE